MTEEKNKSRNAVYIRRHPRGKAKTSARAIRLAERRAEVYYHRRDGKSYPEISKIMRLPVSTLQRYANYHLENLIPRETLEVDRQRQLDRLDDLYARAHQRVVAGDLAFIDKCRRIVEAQAKLQGFISAQSGAQVQGANVNVILPSDDAVRIKVVGVRPDPERWKDSPLPPRSWQEPKALASPVDVTPGPEPPAPTANVLPMRPAAR